MRKLVLFAATGAGTGYSPWAPGTAGSLLGVGLWALLVSAGQLVVALGLVSLTALAVWAAGRAEPILGHDDGRIVIDEVLGMAIALAWLPLRWEVVLTAFLLFRLVDIFKPPPCRQVERWPGGWGVVADDVVAGLYANAAGQLLFRLLLPGAPA